MSEIYLISDLHLRHESMAKHRGFSCSEEHDGLLIENWNKTITKKDVVWILGDITMEKGDYSDLLLLKGIKKIVLGNHDQPQHAKNMLQYVNCVCGVYKYRNAWFTHIPMHPSELFPGEINIHGHLHEKRIDDDRYFNVSPDLNDYTPILLKSILNL